MLFFSVFPILYTIMNAHRTPKERFFADGRISNDIRTGKVRTFRRVSVCFFSLFFSLCAAAVFVVFFKGSESSAVPPATYAAANTETYAETYSAKYPVEKQEFTVNSPANTPRPGTPYSETPHSETSEIFREVSVETQNNAFPEIASLYEKFPLTRIPEEPEEETTAAVAVPYEVPTLTDNLGISYPREHEDGPVFVSADSQETEFSEGAYTVHVLEGKCELRQGEDTFRADKMVLWVSPLQFDENRNAVHHVLMFLEGNVDVTFVTSRTTSQVRGKSWAGRTSAPNEPQISVLNSESQSSASAAEGKTSAQTAFYAHAKEKMFQPARLLLTQYSSAQPLTQNEAAIGDGEVILADQPLHSDANTKNSIPSILSTEGKILPGDVSSFDPNTPRPGARRIGFFQRNDVPLAMNFQYDANTKKYIAIFDKGVTLLIDGADDVLKSANPNLSRLESLQVGTIDISADRLVVWSDSDLQAIQHDQSLDLNKIHLELYLEGNIIFRQGEQEIYAEKMYFDVSTRRGLIREAEVFATVPKVEGLLRLRAEEIRIPDEGTMLANDTFVTTSRIGEPMYRFQMGQLMLRNQKTPKIDRRTGEVERDPETGSPLYEEHRDLIARRTMVKVGNVPVFYLPYFAAPMDTPSQIINRFSIRNDSIFGFQPILGVDAYRLFGIEKPLAGTNWDLNASYYTKRGPGLGTEFSYDRTAKDSELSLGPFSGPGKGAFEFWGIYDTGKDNLGFERRELEPEKKFRYQAFGRHKSTFGNDWELRFQLGAISDRNFQEEYFQNSWYTEPDRATQLEIRKTEENRTLSLWADFRVNDFHTQTQRTPQLDFYWLGQPVFGDLLTWSSYSEIGYVHLYPDTAPTDPADLALWHPVEWEQNRQGLRTSTRHEISYPFQAGAVKIVPFALGEAAYWGEDLYGEADSRLYGQVGIRASLPMWQYFGYQNKLFNINGVMHKVEFDVEALVAGANKSVYELPLYDIPDDRALMDFTHHMSSTLFGGLPIPAKYQMLSYAIRSNIGGWVTSNTELADDLALIRFGMHHRWQTKRGIPGREKIIDFVTFDMNFNLYPDPERDNFGETIGLLDYDLRWYPGDRIMLYTSGMFDFFSDGLHMVNVGAVMNRTGKGSIFTGLHYLTGSVDNVVMSLGYNYRMSEKWVSTFSSTFDISGKGNIGERLTLTRVGESFLFTAGIGYDAPSDNFSVMFALEPRFGKKGNVARQFNITPPGVDGID